MKNLINWADFLSLIPSLTIPSAIGALVTLGMRVLRIIKTKNREFTWFVVFELFLEALTCVLLGVLLGLFMSAFTSELAYVCATSGIGGMFGEKIYAKFSKKVDDTDIEDLLHPENLIEDVLVKDGDGTLNSDDSKKNDTTEMRKPRIFALCIGLNAVNATAYNGNDGKLKSAEKDASDMGAYLETKGHKVKYLLGKNANRDTVRQHLTEISQFAQLGDLVVFYYSGHGGQYNHEGKTYESYCLYDGQLPEKEVRTIFAAFRKGVRSVAILDCCHGGGFDKALVMENRSAENAYRTKAMPFDPFSDALDMKGTLVHKGKSVILPNTKWYTACAKTELALDGNQNGLFTAANMKALQDNDSLTYEKWHTAALAVCGNLQTPQLKNGTKATKFQDSEIIFSV